MKRKLFEGFIKIIIKFIPLNDKRVIFIDSTPNSGSNIKKIYDAFNGNEDGFEYKYMLKKFDEGSIKDKLKRIFEIASAKYLITSHSYIRKRKSQVMIDFWHGIPLKRMGLMEGRNMEIKKANYYISSSDTYSTLLNSCIGSKGPYGVTGFPRNDYLMNKREDILKKIRKDFNISSDKKIVVFMPTFRSGFKRTESDLNRDINIFGLNDVSSKEINMLLEKENIHIIAKLHPIEEQFIKENISPESNISIVAQDYLEENKLDVYEVLAVSDALITDYSSVYFDYLLMDKPMLFLSNDLEEYRKNRGFLLEPLEMWRPGISVGNYEELTSELSKLFELETYKEERRVIREMLHRHKDGDSTIRAKTYIEGIIKNS